MDEALLGTFRQQPAAYRLIGNVALGLALALVVALQHWQTRLKQDESRVWWASNGRDMVNIVALGALVLALWLVGFPPASGLLFGATIILVTHAVENAAAARSVAVNALLALVIAVPLLFAPQRAQQLVEHVAERLLSDLARTTGELAKAPPPLLDR
ncbi:MAG: hypothetical protein ACK4N5_15230 [Myxococcales bacterium]